MLVLPLTVPVLIFGVSASNAAIVGPVPFGTPFTILCALTLMSLVRRAVRRRRGPAAGNGVNGDRRCPYSATSVASAALRTATGRGLREHPWP